MTALQEAQTVLKRLTPDERYNLLEELSHESVEVARGIFRTPGVCGGEPCVRGMRLPVWLLEEGRRHHASDEHLLAAHPALTRDDLVNAWNYVTAHRDEIDRAIRENNEV